jgi:hypothetical protein
MIGHTVRKSAPGADPGITDKAQCLLDLSVFVAARAGRLREAPATSRRENQQRRRGGPRRTLAGGAGNIAPRKRGAGFGGTGSPACSSFFRSLLGKAPRLLA